MTFIARVFFFFEFCREERKICENFSVYFRQIILLESIFRAIRVCFSLSDGRAASENLNFGGLVKGTGQPWGEFGLLSAPECLLNGMGVKEKLFKASLGPFHYPLNTFSSILTTLSNCVTSGKIFSVLLHHCRFFYYASMTLPHKKRFFLLVFGHAINRNSHNFSVLLFLSFFFIFTQIRDDVTARRKLVSLLLLLIRSVVPLWIYVYFVSTISHSKNNKKKSGEKNFVFALRWVLLAATDGRVFRGVRAI